MHRIEIQLMKSVNGVLFGSQKKNVRKSFGSNYTEFPHTDVNTEEFKKSENEINQMMAEIAGKSVEEFLNGVPEIETRIFDDYPFGQVTYNTNQIFEAFEIPSNTNIELIVDGIKCPDFSIKSFMCITNDFIWDKLNTSWISYSKQISLYCPQNKNTIECVLFGCKDYYKKDK